MLWGAQANTCAREGASRSERCHSAGRAKTCAGANEQARPFSKPSKDLCRSERASEVIQLAERRFVCVRAQADGPSEVLCKGSRCLVLTRHYTLWLTKLLLFNDAVYIKDYGYFSLVRRSSAIILFIFFLMKERYG